VLRGARDKLTQAGLDVTRLEAYLADADFEAALTMPRANFAALPVCIVYVCVVGLGGGGGSVDNSSWPCLALCRDGGRPR
jgi:hypothetical protein